jgi:uncharacterized repeat protein (TIGR02543 family)
VYSTSTIRPEIYTVTFDINDGSGTTPDARTVISDSNIPLPDGSGFSRDDYKFGGWNTLADGKGTNYNAGSSYRPTGDIILYARWYNYTISFNMNGGSGTPPDPIRANAGSPITMPDGSGFSKSGYNFNSWNTLADGTGISFPAGSAWYIPTGDATLYASWYCTVTFSANGGNRTPPEPRNVSEASGSGFFLPGGGGLSRAGYTFGGWNTQADGKGNSYNAGYLYKPTGNITLYVRWYAGTGNPSAWTNGSLTAATDEVWHSFAVTSGTRYYIWWNDKYGDRITTKTAYVAVGARYAGSTGWIFGGTDISMDARGVDNFGWTRTVPFTSDRDGTVEIRVIPYGRISPNIGTYGIVFSTNDTRPPVPVL